MNHDYANFHLREADNPDIILQSLLRELCAPLFDNAHETIQHLLRALALLRVLGRQSTFGSILAIVSQYGYCPDDHSQESIK